MKKKKIFRLLDTVEENETFFGTLFVLKWWALCLLIEESLFTNF